MVNVLINRVILVSIKIYQISITYKYSIAFVPEMSKFNYKEMSKNANTIQTYLEELYTTDNLTLLKRAITELTNKQDYTTFNTLFRRNTNANEFDTRTFNEDILQETKCNGELHNEARTVPRTTQNEEENQ